MFFSKLWFCLATVALGVGAALLVVAPKNAQRDLDDQVEGRLVAADGAVESLLKVYARRWIDAAAQVSSDAELDEALAESQRSSANRDLLHQTVAGRLKYFNGQWKASFVLAVDANGVVMGRAGLDESRWGDDISGRPVIAESLRGWRLDDTWDMAGHLYRVCATPIIARDKYVGALVVGHELGSELAARLREMLGLDVAFVAAAKVVGHSGSGLAVESDLGRLASAHSTDAAGVPTVTPLAVGERRFAATLLPLPGEAGEHQSFVALVAERPQVSGAAGFLAAVQAAEHEWRQLAIVGGGLLFVLLVGFTAMSAEHTGRVRRLKREVQDLGRGGRERLDGDRHPGEFGAIARSINAAMDRSARERPQSRPLARSSDDDLPAARNPPRGLTPGVVGAAKPPKSLKGGLTPAIVPAVRLPQAPSFDDAPEDTALGAPASLPGVALPPRPQPVSPVLVEAEGGAPPLLASLDETTSRDAARQDATRPRGPTSGRPIAGSAMPTVGVPQQAAPHVNATGARPAALSDMPSLVAGSLTNSRPLAEALASGGFDETPLPPAFPPLSPAAVPPAPALVHDEQATMPGAANEFGVPRALPTIDDVAANPLSEEFRQVYEEFVATKRSCGEPTESLTFERFVEKLRKNREQLMDKHGCSAVRFQVYVKDGKAALRATPVQ